MARKIKLISVAFALLTLLALAACLFAGCNKTESEGELSVTFDLNYDGAPQAEVKSFLRADFSKLEAPERRGYSFKGWTNDRDGKVKVSERTVKDGSTLYAQWEKESYTVKFFVNGTQIGEAKQVLFEDAATPPAQWEFWEHIPHDKAFDGWAEDFESVESDLEVNALLVSRSATAFFKDGEDIIAEYGGKTGGVIPAPPALKKDGLTFDGWKTADGTAYVEGTSTFPSEVTYLACWTISPLSDVSVRRDGGEISELSISYGEKAALTAELEETFEGISYAYEWQKDGVKAQDGASVTIEGLGVGEYQYIVVVTASRVGAEDATKSRQIAVSVVKARAEVEVSSEVIEIDWTGNETKDLVHRIDAKVKTAGAEGALNYLLFGDEFTDETALKDGGAYPVEIVLDNDSYFSDAVVTIKIKAARLGGINYTLEDALALGGDIVLLGDAVLRGEHTLQTGSTLTLPYDGSSDGSKLNADGTVNGARVFYVDYDGTHLKRTLTLKDDAKLNVRGTLQVGGVTGADYNACYQGATSGDYAQINVEKDASIIVSGGTLNNYGYVKGDGKLTANEGGTVITPFVVRDYQGGSSTAGKYQGGGISPISQYEMPNIQVLQRYEAGAKLRAHASLYTASIVRSYNKMNATVIGSAQTGAKASDSDGGIIVLSDGYIEIKTSSVYNAAETQLHKKFATHADMTICGNAEMNFMQFNISLAGANVTVSTDRIPFPLPYNYAVTMKSGTLKVPYAYKLLPGSSFTIEEGATVSFEGEKASLAVYDGSWTDSNPMGTQAYPSDLGEAKLVVRGELKISSGSIGGNVVTEGNGKVTIAEGVLKSVSVKEGYGAQEGTLHFVFHPVFQHEYEFTLNGERA